VTDQDANRLSRDSYAAGDATGWFERLYEAAADGDAVVPWDHDEPRPSLVEWMERRGLEGAGRRAIVVGCGFGAEAEYIAGLGFDTLAFDISPTAIRLARERHPDSRVNYTSADLLDLPADWVGAFDLVVEVITVQSLPDSLRAQAIAGVANLVAPGGTLIAIAAARDHDGEPVDGPPWPLTRDEIDSFARSGALEPVEIERFTDTMPRWRAEFRRSGPAETARAFAAAVNARDLDAALALWEDDAVIVAPDGTATDDVATAVATLIENGVTMDIGVERVHASGRTAVATGTLTMGDASGAFVVVYARDSAGHWRIAIDAPWGLPLGQPNVNA
jgi:SAM-dependent methyltransferase